ncbi:hypothetical protein SKAU_G00198150 [Synaphobranchus kaupii]|uniref:Uncharacterized protein n=1 Tax=Synaphobranchus kaupii TaxID=118154 RepID=A0A9Q1FF07_SYNKA|nr:hypothetical protein SKAU_G00198150 [Synaphobranchus kaupii]
MIGRHCEGHRTINQTGNGTTCCSLPSHGARWRGWSAEEHPKYAEEILPKVLRPYTAAKQDGTKPGLFSDGRRPTSPPRRPQLPHPAGSFPGGVSPLQPQAKAVTTVQAWPGAAFGPEVVARAAAGRLTEKQPLIPARIHKCLRAGALIRFTVSES